MDKNRKIVVSMLILVVLSCVLAIVDISLNMQGAKRELFPLSAPEGGPGVGIVRVYGPISVSRDDGPFGLEIGSDAIVKRLDDLERDGRIKAIVLRINSPGGTVAATQEIYEKLMKMRKKNIKLVASMGELCASGGYYIASACDCIMANHGTLTGSIGVIAVSPNLRGLFEKLGIRMNVIKSGKYKDILASYKDLSPEETDLIQKLIDSSYQKFLKDVSLGRNIPISDIEPYADGRLMNGESALKGKLVDEIGTFGDALRKSRELAKLPEDSAVYDEIKSPLDRILMSMDGMLNRTPSLEHKMIFDGSYPMIEYRYQP